MKTIDDLGDGYKIIQYQEGFRFGIDAVLLADFAAKRVKPKSKIVEVGTGTGIIPILMNKRKLIREITAFEIQKKLADLAEENMRLNALDERVRILNEDLRTQKHFSQNSLDFIISNPPYIPINNNLKETRVRTYEEEIARSELTLKIEDLFDFAETLKTGGNLLMIGRSHRLGEFTIKARERDLALKRIQFIHPRIEQSAKNVLMEFSKGGADFLKVEPPIVIYDKDNNYTKTINQIYEG